jgi:glycogen operon protein
VLQLVTDSLRYWVEQTRIDGFRFDLATIMAREPEGFDNQSGFLKACTQDPVLGRVRLIAEPWDCGPGGYQVGSFPPGWAEWNGRFRDDVRDFWRGHSTVGQLAERLCASSPLFNHQGRRPWACINLVTAHDGFTLNDAVTYNERHNEANGDHNQDGSSDNRSWNCGVEGPSNDPAIETLRQRQIRNMLATLLLAQGTPMMTAGDEFARTQNGNNNSYCQDNATNWIDWTLREKNDSLVQFVRKLARLRHKLPILRRNIFLNGQWIEEQGFRDVTWFHPRGLQMSAADWQDGSLQSIAMLLEGRAQTGGARQTGKEATLLMLINGSHQAVPFTLPDYESGSVWALQIDTSIPDEAGEPSFAGGQTFTMTGRSLVLFDLRAMADSLP